MTPCRSALADSLAVFVAIACVAPVDVLRTVFAAVVVAHSLAPARRRVAAVALLAGPLALLAAAA